MSDSKESGARQAFDRSLVQWLTRAHDRFARTPVAPSAWLRAGFVKPLAWAMLLTMPLAVAGPVRVLTRLPLLISLPVALVVVALLMLPLWPALTRRDEGARLNDLVGSAAVAIVSGFSVYCLYTHWFGGLPNFRGTDPGFHVWHSHRFAHVDPKEYLGFDAMYAFLYFIRLVSRCNDFWAFVVVFYFQLVVVTALPVMAAFSGLWRVRSSSTAAYAVGSVVTVAVALPILYYAELIEQHQYQTDGFYPQLFALMLLLGVWLADTLVRVAALRLALVGALFVFMRFTYGLNLGDLAVTVGGLCAIEALDRDARRWFRALLVLVAVVFVAVAWRAYVEMRTLESQIGHFLAYDVQTLQLGELLALVMLAMVAIASTKRGPFADSGLLRMTRVPLLFGVASVAVLALYVHAGGQKRYYYYKYSFYPLVLLASACMAVVPIVVAQTVNAFASRRRRVAAAVVAVAACALTVGAVRQWYEGTRPHHRGFVERCWGKPPFFKNEDNLPLADLGAWKRIESTLDKEHKKFAGYVTSQFGMMMFMNAAFDIPDFGWPIWFGPGPKVGVPGTCLFWDEGSPRDWLVWEHGLPLRDYRQRLIDDPAKSCVGYRAYWDPDGPRRILCHRCY